MAGSPESRPGAPGRLPGWLVPAACYAVSLACLIWVYRGFDWKSQWPRLAATDWRWVAVAVASDILVYVCQGFRWNVLLRPLARVPVYRSVQAIYIGLFANEVLPFRTGEVIRCFLKSRWSGLRFSVVLSSAVIERLLDGIWLVLGFLAASRYVPLPRPLVEGTKVLAVVLLIFGVLNAWAVLHREHAHGAVSRSRWANLLRSIVDGLHAMGRSSSFPLAALLSFVYLALQVVPIYAAMRGFGLDLSVWAAGVVLVVLRVGSIPPQAPSNVGSFQFFTVLALRLLHVDRSQAVAFATLLFVLVTVPLWLGGFVALLATGFRIRELHEHARNHMANARRARSAREGGQNLADLVPHD